MWNLQVIGVWVLYKGNNVEELVFMVFLERFSFKDECEGIDLEMQYMIGYVDDQVLSFLGDDFYYF